MAGPGLTVGHGGVQAAERFRVYMSDPGQYPVEVVGVLTQLGCPTELAAEYVAAATDGCRPEVLDGVGTVDAHRVSEALRRAGATVSVEPSGGPHVSVVGTGPPPGPDLLEVATVERYIDAYNNGDRSRLVSCLSPSAVLSDATGQVLIQGPEAIGRRLADIFAHYPDRRVVVLGRLVSGPWVIDHQRTTYGGGASEDTVLCTLVHNGLIERLVLLRMG